MSGLPGQTIERNPPREFRFDGNVILRLPKIFNQK